MSHGADLHGLETGIRNFDALFAGGLPRGSVTAVCGPPGSGKTILAQQLCFHAAAGGRRALYFNTLSEPTAKTLRYASQFSYFERTRLDEDGVAFVDLGAILRGEGLAEAARLVMHHVRRVQPEIVVIDSFRVFGELAGSPEELRKFGYELAVQLMAWETTTFVLGEYDLDDIASDPIFSIVDGLVLLTQREESGEQQRFIRVIKMRGVDHSRDEHSFLITGDGIEIFAPRVTLQREAGAEAGPEPERLRTGNPKLDELLGQGIPLGSSLLVAGVAGTGKTALLLEFIYRGAVAGERGIIFSFEETAERLRAAAWGLGWDLGREVERGMIELVFIPQPNIMVEKHLLMIAERVAALGARRVAIDSVSVFLHKITDPQRAREKVFQLASVVQNARAVGFFATDVPYGAARISRFGVEETVVDGVLLLSSTEEGLERRRYIEVYKLRNTDHLKGRHIMTIGRGGATIFPRYVSDEAEASEPPAALDTDRRLSTGVPRLDQLLGGGLLARSSTIVSGSAGIGKTTLGLQFVLEGHRAGERGLYVSLEEGPAQLLRTATRLGLPLREATEQGGVELLYLPPQQARTHQLLSVLADRIRARGARRLVLDSASHIVTHGTTLADVRQALFALAARFKALDVTSILTLESHSLFSADGATGRAFSPIADNLIVLRYVLLPGELAPSLTVVKTRGSDHDRGTYSFAIAARGVQIGARLALGEGAARKQGSP